MGSRIWRIVGAAFVGMLGFGAVIPMLPVYLHEQLHESTFVTGLLIGFSSAFALLGRLFAGKIADRKGRRIALLLGMAFCAGAGVLYLPMFGVWAIPPARVLHGLGEGFFVTAVQWSSSTSTSGAPAFTMGSTAMTSPLLTRSRRPGGPALGTCGSSCIWRPVPWPTNCRTTE